MSTKIRVQFLNPQTDKARDEWSVTREEIMDYNDYLRLPTDALANTRARLVPLGAEAEYEKAVR